MGRSRLASRFSASRPAAVEPARREFPRALVRRPNLTNLSLPIAALALCAGAPAAAQVSGAIAVESDFRLRGLTMSAGRPVASLRLGLDDDSGVYASGSATVVLTRDEDPRFLGYQVGGGIAKRVGHFWTVDFGIAHNEIRAAYDGGYPYTYTELYAGATRAPFSAYVFVSPNYFRSDFWTVYGQLEASVSPAEHWHLTAHVGSLNYVDTPPQYTVRRKSLYDWRLGVAREIGNFEIHAALTGGGPGRQYYYGESHSKTAIVAGASLSF
jgi:uncharacterized protein (TIGR02001 family)